MSFIHRIHSLARLLRQEDQCTCTLWTGCQYSALGHYNNEVSNLGNSVIYMYTGYDMWHSIVYIYTVKYLNLCYIYILYGPKSIQNLQYWSTDPAKHLPRKSQDFLVCAGHHPMARWWTSTRLQHVNRFMCCWTQKSWHPMIFGCISLTQSHKLVSFYII